MIGSNNMAVALFIYIHSIVGEDFILYPLNQNVDMNGTTKKHQTSLQKYQLFLI